MKAERSRLIPRKHKETLVLSTVCCLVTKSKHVDLFIGAAFHSHGSMRNWQMPVSIKELRLSSGRFWVNSDRIDFKFARV